MKFSHDIGEKHWALILESWFTEILREHKLTLRSFQNPPNKPKPSAYVVCIWNDVPRSPGRTLEPRNSCSIDET